MIISFGSTDHTETDSHQKEAYATNFPKIKGIPEPPCSLPFIGHMHSLGGRSKQNDSTVYSRWMSQLKSNLIQVRIGNQRTVVVGSFAIVKDLWITRAQALIDHPHQPGFLDALGVDITGMPMTPQIKRCRQAAMRALGKPMWPSYYHLLEPSSVSLMQDVLQEGENGEKPMDIYPYIRQVVFSLALSITYGAKMEKADDEFMIDFLKNINAISAVRASTTAYKHFVPLLRLIPESTNETYRTAAARQVQVDHLYRQYLAKVGSGETVNCIVSMLGMHFYTFPPNVTVVTLQVH